MVQIVLLMEHKRDGKLTNSQPYFSFQLLFWSEKILFVYKLAFTSVSFFCTSLLRDSDGFGVNKQQNQQKIAEGKLFQ